MRAGETGQGSPRGEPAQRSGREGQPDRRAADQSETAQRPGGADDADAGVGAGRRPPRRSERRRRLHRLHHRRRRQV